MRRDSLEDRSDQTARVEPVGRVRTLGDGLDAVLEDADSAQSGALLFHTKPALTRTRLTWREPSCGCCG